MPSLSTHQPSVETKTFRILELHADYVCGDSGHCCSRAWRIGLRKKSLPNMRRNLADVGMTPAEIDLHIVPANDDLDESTGAILGRTETGACRFMAGEEGHSSCSLHAGCGHHALPDVCQAFPRLTIRTPAGVYMTLSYTCPTAARLLLNPDGLRETVPRKVYQNRPVLAGVNLEHKDHAPGWVKDAVPRWEAFDYFWRWCVEWAARPGLTPAQSLYSLGIVVQALERHAPRLTRLEPLIEMLDSVMSNPVEAFGKPCRLIAPSTELGLQFMEMLIGQLVRYRGVGPEWGALWNAPESTFADRRMLIGEYDACIRPHLANYESIERNYVASRLFANPLAYRAARLRAGYFVNVMQLVCLRFSLLAVCLAEGKSLDEAAWLKAASITDDLFLHSDKFQTEFLKRMDTFAQTPLENLKRPALF
jgi:lysine-N-methylase